MKAYQLFYVTSYTEYDEGFSIDQEERMPGKIFLKKDKAEAERNRILSLPYDEQVKYQTRFSGYLSDVLIREMDIEE